MKPELLSPELRRVRPGRVPRPTSSLRLPPLEAEAEAAEAAAAAAEGREERASPGHLGVLRGMRKSQSMTTKAWDSVSDIAAPQAGWGRPQAASTASSSSLRLSPTLRVRRLRRPMDLCPSGAGGSAFGSASTGALAASGASFASAGPQRPIEVEATAVSGNGHADVAGAASTEEAARSKARAVAMLQKLFFEELSNGSGQDANSAAVAALRRLTEASAAPAEPAPAAQALDTASESRLTAPQRPGSASLRRPAPMVSSRLAKVKVQN